MGTTRFDHKPPREPREMFPEGGFRSTKLGEEMKKAIELRRVIREEAKEVAEEVLREHGLIT
jgi:hypothetical protein